MVSFTHVFLLSTENPDIDIGGKNTHIKILMKGLAKKGISHTLICPDPSFYHPNKLCTLFLAFKYKDLKILTSPHIRHYYALIDNILPKLLNLNLEGSVILHCHDVITMQIICNSEKFSKFSKILTVHGYYSQEIIDDNLRHHDDAKSEYLIFCENIEKLAYSAANKIIAVDTRIKNYLVSNFNCPPEKVVIFQNVTDIDQFYPVDDDKKSLIRKKLGYQNKDLIILVPRRLVPKNGVEFAIRAIKGMKGENIRLIIAGDGILRDSLRLLSGDDTRIIFLGDVSHDSLIDYYHICDIVLIPSITSQGIQEATSLSMLEGMACGKVVICSNIGGMKEIFETSNAIIPVSEKDPDSIISVIESLVQSGNITDIGRKARDYILKNHSYLSYTDNLIKLYETGLKE